MTDKMAERVLVVPTEHFHALGLFQGFSHETNRYIPALLAPEHLSFRPRSEVETDPSFKQIIPYIVLRHGESVFRYRRGAAGTEARLQAKTSIGVGGHISEEDAAGPGDLYHNGMRRELEEEVRLATDYREQIIGLINDDSTPVGAVHLGIVHVLDLAEPRATHREDALTESGFVPFDEVRAGRKGLETWSRFAIDALI